MGCDPNKLAVQVLRRNIILNNIDTTRISIRCGDSRSLTPIAKVDRALHTVFGDEAMELNKMDYKTKIVLVGFSMGAIIGANDTAGL